MESSATGSVASEPAAFLVVQRGAARLEVVPMLPDAPVSVGRAASNRLVLADPKCSRQHCEFFHRDGRWHVRDLDSRNGLTVNGRRVLEEQVLSVGETVGIGACTLLYTDREPQDPAAAATQRSLPPYAVIERKSGTKYDGLRAGGPPLAHGRHGVAELFQLAQCMIGAADVPALTDCVLAGLQRSAPRVRQPAVAAGICLLNVNCESHEGFLVQTLKFADNNPGFQELLRGAASGLAAIAVNGRPSAASALLDIGVPSQDPTRAPVALATATVALRNSTVLLPLLERHPDQRAAIGLVAEGFDMLEEDLDKERFFAFVRRTYWASAEGSPTKALMQALIRYLDF